MNTNNNNTNEAIQDRLSKGNTAWRNIKNSYIPNKTLDTKLRLQLYDTLIGSILLYSLHVIPLNVSNLTKMQSFYSKCIRIAPEGTFYENEKKIKNQEIRNKHNIPTMESKLYYYRLNMFRSLKTTLPISYLNGQNYIDNELPSLDEYINKLKT